MSTELTTTPTVNADTGTRRLNLWAYDSESSGAYGDRARGTAYEATYLSDRDGGGYCAEIAVYPILCEDGTYGIEEMATIGPAICEDDVWRPDDSADITYDWADVWVFDSLESAQETADRIGKSDYSHALHLRNV